MNSNVETVVDSILNECFLNPNEVIKNDILFLYKLGEVDERWMNALSESIKESSNPERYITGFVNYIKALDSADLLVKRCSQDRRFLYLFERTFAQSPFLSEVIVRFPELPFTVYESNDITRVLSSKEWVEKLNLSFISNLGEDVISFLKEKGLISFQGNRYDLKPLMNYLRWEHRKCLFRIAVRDMVFHQDVSSVAEDLSNLADGLLDLVYKILFSLYSVRYGRPQVMFESQLQESRFVILAMGKLGGRELNFSSDIDLLFLYEGEGETSKGITNREFFSWLCQDLISFFSEHTESGIIYRVDMRLRPYGRVGSLVETVSNAVEYYYQYGRAWERQALVKCRPCAGDLSLGYEFIKNMKSFIFPKFFDDKTLEDISRTKTLAEKHSIEQGKGIYDVKLGKGGIRDIEFTVQLLQMLNGGRSKSLRVTNTIEAIRNLAVEGYLNILDADTLIRNYKFLRELEHRLQIEFGTQKHQLPEDKKLLDEFARRLGYATGSALLNTYLLKTTENREILHKFLSVHGSGNLWVYELISKEPMDEELYSKLREYGFGNPEKAKELFISLVDGPSHNLNPLHIRENVIKIIPHLCKMLSKMKNPDLSLEQFCSQMLKIPIPGAVYSILSENPNLCEVFVYLTSFAPSLFDIWSKNPSVLEILFQEDTYSAIPSVSDLQEILESMKKSVNPLSAHYRLKEEELVRIATGDVLGKYSVFEVSEQLTQTAEVILRDIAYECIKEISNLHGDVGVPFAIVGLGKVGGKEMTYGSDLDLIFVYDDEGCGGDIKEVENTREISLTEFFSKVSSKIIERLSQPTQFGVLYEVDPRLRPYGSKGVLAVSLTQLKEYYECEAEVWEKMALMKARIIFAHGSIAEKLIRIITKLAFYFPVSKEDIMRAENIRKKMVQQSSPDNLKKSEGGVAELEYIVRWWQRMKIEQSSELATPSVIGALNILKRISPENSDMWEFLEKTFETYLLVLNRYRLFTGIRSTTLSEETLDILSGLLSEIQFTPSLSVYIKALKIKVHKIYLETLETLYNWARF